MKIKTAVLCCSLLVLFSLPVIAQTPTPQNGNKWGLGDSIPEKRAAAMLAAIEKGDEASVRQFFAENVAPDFRDQFPMEEHIGQFKQMHQNLAGLEVTSVEVNPNSITLTLKLTNGKFRKMSLGIDRDAPNLINNIQVRPMDAPGPGATTDAAALKFASLADADQQLQAMADKDRFSGVVLISKGGQIALHQAYGLADRAHHLANRPDTMFDIGSITKQFTAASILRLAQEGRLNLDDTIGKYLKGFPPAIADKVTIRQLLQHRSGFGDYLSHPQVAQNPKRFQTVNDLLDLIRTTPLGFEPGTRERYSNSGYVVLGGIIESVTGRSYYDVVKDFVYQPAKMNSSGSFAHGSGMKNMAIGYTRDSRGETRNDGNAPDSLQPNDKFFPPKGSPAGGSYSTAEDLKRYIEALLANRLFNQEYTDLTLNRYVAKAFGATAPAPARQQFGIAGGAEGVNAIVIVNLQTRDMVIVLANRDSPVAEDIGKSIFRMINSAGN